MRDGISLFLRGVSQEAAGAQPAPPRSLAGVPERVARAWRLDLLSGYRDDPAVILSPVARTRSDDLVAVRDIEFSSICMHHLLPFQGRAHVAYVPTGRIVGLSRLGRLVDCLSRRLQLQESLTREIVDALQAHLSPSGAACIVEATHACVASRGTRKTGSRVVTSAFSGAFHRDGARRREVLSVLGLSARNLPAGRRS